MLKQILSFCFTNLMSELRDNFCKTLDKSSIGISGLMTKLNNLLKIKDPEAWQDFEDKKIMPQYYSFRWLTLLLSQEFDLPDVLRLWDSLFADPYRFEFLLYVCVGMIVVLREQILDGSFADNLKLLQSNPVQDVHIVIKKAEELQKETYSIPTSRIKPLQKPKIPSAEHQHKKTLPPLFNANSKPEPQIEEQLDEEPPIIATTIHPLPFLEPPTPFDALDDTNDNDSIVKTHPLE